MRYKPDHNQRIRGRILREASAALRQNGPRGVVVADIMARAGLTHGGFYVHFKSKDDLIVAALEDAFHSAGDGFRELTDGRTPAQALAAYINAYLSQQHRDQRERGCAVSAVAADATRLAEPARKAFEAGVEAMVARIAGWLRDMGRERPEEEALSVQAELVGALVLSRAVADPRTSNRILKSARDGLRDRLALS